MYRRVFCVVSIGFITAIAGCSSKPAVRIYDGRMDTDLVKIITPTGGIVRQFALVQGNAVVQNQTVAEIDVQKLQLQKSQLELSKKELEVQLTAIDFQLAQIKSDLTYKTALFEKTRIMVREQSIPEQKLDELDNSVRIQSLKLKEVSQNKKLILVKLEQLKKNDQLLTLQMQDAVITAPVSGVVLTTFTSQGECVLPGTLLAQMADVSHLFATIYVPIQELNQFKVGQTVSVKIEGVPARREGKVSWISSTAEFTPKTIMTQETRSTLVYAVKVSVPNPDGVLKIGLPAEVQL